jgi:hypothetical protein
MIFLTHDPEALKNHYGDRALAGLRALAPVRLNAKAAPLSETVAQVAEIRQGRAPKGAVNAERASRLARLRKNA